MNTLFTFIFWKIWQHVKNANPSMSVCEVGANIGRMWREMPEADKQRYNDDFSREKVQ
jgi:HMG (high mobility group) box